MLQACGVTAFLVPVGRAATARIKQRPEDFVVVEEDPAGARTDAVDYQLPVPPAPAAVSTTSPRHTSEGAVAPSTSTSAVAADNNDGDDDTTAVSAECLLTDATREALHAVFGSKHDAITQYDPAAASTAAAAAAVGREIPLVTEEHIVGVFNRREDRQRLHHALKAAFPHLRSETRRASLPQVPADAQNYHVVVRYDNDYLLLAHLLGEHAADAVEAWRSAESRSDSFLITAAFPLEATKDTRRAFHEMMARRYPDVTCRVANGKVTLGASTRQRGKRSRGGDWDRGGGGGGGGSAAAASAAAGVFTHLLVRKRNLDMMELRILLAEHFRVPDAAVCTAGLKDKCAVTYQRCSVPGKWQQEEQQQQQGDVMLRLPWPSDPSSYAEILQMSAPFPAPVVIGQLRGNWFRIHLTDVRGITRAELAGRVRRVASDGFLNYFGQQRFSEHTRSVKDHVGVHLLAGRWADAVRCALGGVPELYASFPAKMEVRHVPTADRDAQCVVQALRRVYRTRYACLPQPLSADDVAGGTTRWQQLCHEALMAVPFAIRVLWLHGAQSLIFNMTLSKLHHAGGAMVTVGTLPLVGHQVTVDDAVRPMLEQTLAELCLSNTDVLLQQRKVLGVPLPGAMRQRVVQPVECNLVFDDNNAEEEGPKGEDGFKADLSFFLPPSGYATIFLREVLGCDQWW
ncbi:tRNA pseudouridine13 synthase [Trypanosoma grayi]|uniref:tRNA pseudouridine13 synthase n=1 Tax=Trypanosoma grayi TaxID=71804 RepID=UPI0004F4AFAA|nr:tRNA pseudouridine13 synthase [Trypanosoma grayi]KEG10629.1 tRNA pseudouridine13 synthase [Trypanosoma grayi]